MRKILRWRYYCEFCRRAGGSGGHIARHEKGCTKNPNRECGMCKILADAIGGAALADLIAILPDPAAYKRVDKEYRYEYFDKTLDDAIAQALPKLRQAAGNCPACIMAAIRQRGIPVPMVAGFDFTKECAALWAEFNANQLANHEY